MSELNNSKMWDKLGKVYRDFFQSKIDIEVEKLKEELATAFIENNGKDKSITFGFTVQTCLKDTENKNHGLAPVIGNSYQEQEIINQFANAVNSIGHLVSGVTMYHWSVERYENGKLVRKIETGKDESFT